MFRSKTACINPWKTSAALATLCVCSAAIYAQETERWKRSPDVWEEPRRPGGRSIQTYEQEQRDDPPPKEAVLFAGSATIWMWDLERWFPEYKTIKRGFGCSMISDSISLGADARQRVMMEISGRVISGVIWIGKRKRLIMPKMTTRMQATITATGLESAILVSVTA